MTSTSPRPASSDYARILVHSMLRRSNPVIAEGRMLIF